MLYFYSCLVRIGKNFTWYEGGYETTKRISTLEELLTIKKNLCDNEIIPYLKKTYPEYDFTDFTIKFVIFHPM